MYSEQHYLARSILAMELSEQPENIRKKKAYLALALNWKKMADIAAKATTIPCKLLK
jgi:hypothetical protein